MTSGAVFAQHNRDDLHHALRAATRGIHDRLHCHAGFAAIQDGTIGLTAYQSLLARLYGFHYAFEQAAHIGTDISKWLHDDLKVLGAAGERIATLPRCAAFSPIKTTSERLGALYVIEGSTLGGLALCRGLDHLFGAGVVEGRRFFAGRGRGTAPAWSAFLANLKKADDGPTARAEIVGTAVHIFSVFEKWLAAWEDTSLG